MNLKALAPDLRGLFTDLGPLIKVSRKGLPALERILDDTRPLLARLEPYLRTLQPMFDYLGLYKREITRPSWQRRAAPRRPRTPAPTPAS